MSTRKPRAAAAKTVKYIDDSDDEEAFESLLKRKEERAERKKTRTPRIPDDDEEEEEEEKKASPSSSASSSATKNVLEKVRSERIDENVPNQGHKAESAVAAANGAATPDVIATKKKDGNKKNDMNSKSESVSESESESESDSVAFTASSCDSDDDDDDDDDESDSSEEEEAPKKKNKTLPKTIVKKPSPSTRSPAAPVKPAIAKRSSAKVSPMTSPKGKPLATSSSSSSSSSSSHVSTALSAAATTENLVDITKGPPVNTENGAAKLIKEYMKLQNRPYSAIQIFDNLHKRIQKSAVEKVLMKLSKEEDKTTSHPVLCEKEYGKAKIYYYNQAQLPSLTASDMSDLVSEVTALNGKLKSLEAQSFEAKTKVEKLMNEPTDDELDGALKELQTVLETKKRKADAISGPDAKPIDPQSRQKGNYYHYHYLYHHHHHHHHYHYHHHHHHHYHYQYHYQYHYHYRFYYHYLYHHHHHHHHHCHRYYYHCYYYNNLQPLKNLIFTENIGKNEEKRLWISLIY